MIGGGAAKKEAQAASIEQARQRQLQEIAQQRQEEALRAQQAETAQQTRATGRPARGRRLLEWAGDTRDLAQTLGA